MFGAALARPCQLKLVNDGMANSIFILLLSLKQPSAILFNIQQAQVKPKTINVNKEQSHRWIVEYGVWTIVAQWPDWCPQDIQI